MSNPLLEMNGLPPFSQIKPEHVEPAVDQLLADKGFGKKIAVAINGAFVPRTTYHHQMVNEGDSIEILVPMQGG